MGQTALDVAKDCLEAVPVNDTEPAEDGGFQERILDAQHLSLDAEAAGENVLQV